MAFFDAAYDRHAREQTEFIEGVRAGTIVARDAKAYQRWRSDVNRRTGQLAGRTLKELMGDLGGNVERTAERFRPN